MLAWQRSGTVASATATQGFCSGSVGAQHPERECQHAACCVAAVLLLPGSWQPVRAALSQAQGQIALLALPTVVFLQACVCFFACGSPDGDQEQVNMCRSIRMCLFLPGSPHRRRPWAIGHVRRLEPRTASCIGHRLLRLVPDSCPRRQ
jgi:hypothetical protein